MEWGIQPMQLLELEKITAIVAELKQDFEAIAMSRSAYVLENLVIKAHEHPTQQWLQCVLEMRIKYNVIRRHLVNREKLQRDLKTIEDDLDYQLKLIDLDDMDWSLLSAVREFMALYAIYQQFDKHYSREEIEAGQVEYWRNRLIKQAKHDILSTGRISVGNLEGLRQIGIVPIETNGRIELGNTNELT
jgi:hypothetical protein